VISWKIRGELVPRVVSWVMRSPVRGGAAEPRTPRAKGTEWTARAD
jgi:hypothetical protein